MGVTVRIGDKINASEIKTGTKGDNSWGMVKVKADKGYNTITLWIDNVADMDITATVYKIDKILSVSHNDRKYEKDGQEKWAKDINANVVIVPDAFSEIDDVPSNFEKLDDAIPF